MKIKPNKMYLVLMSLLIAGLIIFRDSPITRKLRDRTKVTYAEKFEVEINKLEKLNGFFFINDSYYFDGNANSSGKWAGGDPYHLIKIGDIVMKQAYSDSLFIQKGNNDYVFDGFFRRENSAYGEWKVEDIYPRQETTIQNSRFGEIIEVQVDQVFIFGNAYNSKDYYRTQVYLSQFFYREYNFEYTLIEDSNATNGMLYDYVNFDLIVIDDTNMIYPTRDWIYVLKKNN